MADFVAELEEGGGRFELPVGCRLSAILHFDFIPSINYPTSSKCSGPLGEIILSYDN
jgi:hypothetical protein